MAYYQRIHFSFEGLEKDLRPKARDWPDLVNDNGYSFCNRLGFEAKEQGIDWLLPFRPFETAGRICRYSRDRR